MFDRKEYMKQWRKNNREKANKHDEKWRNNNRDKKRELDKECHKSKSYVEQRKKRIKHKYKTDKKFSLTNKARSMVNHCLKKNRDSQNLKNLFGFTIKDLIKHLKKTIPEGCTWQDYLEGRLQIDHIIPIYVFNYKRPEDIDFKRCWSLENLRLLPKRENMFKGKKFYKPFQLALRIC